MHRIKHMQHSTPGAEKLRVAQHQSRHLLPSRCPIANCQELPLLPGSWGDVGPAAACFTQRISTRSETTSHKSPNHTGRWANADSSVVNLSLLYLVPLSFYLTHPKRTGSLARCTAPPPSQTLPWWFQADMTQKLLAACGCSQYAKWLAGSTGLAKRSSSIWQDMASWRKNLADRRLAKWGFSPLQWGYYERLFLL